MSEDRIDPELLTIQEIVQGQLDGHKLVKIDLARSEVGGWLSLNAASAVGSASDFSSQLTGTKFMTGRGTLSSAGIKFHLKYLLVDNAAAKICTVVLFDSSTKRVQFIVPSSTCREYREIITHHFSSDVKIIAGTGPTHATIGGIAEIVSI